MVETIDVCYVHTWFQPFLLDRFQFAVIWYNNSLRLIPLHLSNTFIYWCPLGFYRVNYDTQLWTQLVKQLNVSHGDIHVLNRAQLIDDSFNLARAGMLDYYVALNLSTYLQNEDDYVPWYTAIECLSYVVERMRRSTEGYSYIKVTKFCSIQERIVLGGETGIKILIIRIS